MNKITLTIGLLLALFIPQYVHAQSCNIPSSCAPGENLESACENVIEPFPCFTGNEPISGQNGVIGTFNEITADDSGLIGTKYEDTEENDIKAACGAQGNNVQEQIWPLCKNEYILQSPDPSLPVKGLWWRMHDHENSAFYDLYACRTPLVNGNCPDWGSPVQQNEVHTTGECGYSCSGNSELHAPYGNGNQGCVSDIPDARTCQLENRIAWPCAISFDEHVWQTNGCGGETITAFKLRFRAEDNNSYTGDGNTHIHLADVIWVYDAPVCKIQGLKVPAANYEYASQEITLKNASGVVLQRTTAQPYFFTNLPANRQYIVEATGADLLGSTLCTNDTNCHTANASNPAYAPGSSRVVVNCPANGYADLWWHYDSLVTPTPTIVSPTPTNTPPVLKACGDLCSPASQVNATCVSNFCNAAGVCADQDPIGCAAAGSCICPFSTPTPTPTGVVTIVNPYCPF
ncbi:MAG: hypothetical protein NUV98_04260 [Candidatus Roizmanbacteria bacterium]|nr:hypothetical protein [Candidatus Roizmanbacteria bacterium]